MLHILWVRSLPVYYFVPSLVNHVTDKWRKKVEAKAKATAGKCHDSIVIVSMITADIGVMGLHHCWCDNQDGRFMTSFSWKQTPVPPFTRWLCCMTIMNFLAYHDNSQQKLNWRIWFALHANTPAGVLILPSFSRLCIRSGVWGGTSRYQHNSWWNIGHCHPVSRGGWYKYSAHHGISWKTYFDITTGLLLE